MAKTDIWMPLFIGDYLADTTRLTTEQHGAYLLLIMDYWRNGAPPDDDAILANITKMALKEWKKIKAAVLSFFNLVNGFWLHSRIDRELARKAAEARWGKSQPEQIQNTSSSNAPSNAPSIPQAVHKECPLTSPSPSLKPLKSRAGALASRLPPDWTPSEEDIRFCEKERPELDPQAVGSLFRDYWIAQPGVKGRKTDWAATWRNWVRKETGGYRSPAPIKSSLPWYSNDSSILAKGAEFNLSPRPGESMNDFKGRIQAAIDKKGHL